MSSHPHYAHKHYNSQLHRSLEEALMQRIAEHWPHIGGERMLRVCAQVVLNAVDQHCVGVETLKHGQVLWCAIPLDAPPTPRRPLSSTPLRPVILNLSTTDEVKQRIDRLGARARLTQRCVRLCTEAYQQGALLACTDLALLLCYDERQISSVLEEYERTTSTIVPRRATLHDVGTAMTHKKIICLKRWAEGKQPHEIARETNHSIEAVDRYLSMFERVRYCKASGMDAKATAQVLNCGVRLVNEYLEIDQLLEKKTNEAKTHTDGL